MKNYKICAEASVHTLPAFLGATAAELRVLYVLRDAQEALSVGALSSRTGLSDEDVRDALSFWRGAGAVSLADAQKETQEKIVPPKKAVLSADRLSPYAPSDASRMIEEENLASFIELCQQTYGKVLCPADIDILIGMHDQLQLDCEYICLLIAFCVEHGKKPMRYIEKVAFSLYDRGVLTVDELNTYIEKKRRHDTREGKLRRLFGIGARALSKKEDECFMRWCEDYGYDDSVIEMAFDVTVNTVGRASVAYTDKIIRHWHDAGCRNVFEIKELLEKEKDARPKKSKSTKSKPSDGEKESMRSFDVDDLFAHALNRSYGDKDS